MPWSLFSECWVLNQFWWMRLCFTKEPQQRQLNPFTAWENNENFATLKRALTQPYCHPDLSFSLQNWKKQSFFLVISYPVSTFFFSFFYSNPNRLRNHPKQNWSFVTEEKGELKLDMLTVSIALAFYTTSFCVCLNCLFIFLVYFSVQLLYPPPIEMII